MRKLRLLTLDTLLEEKDTRFPSERHGDRIRALEKAYYSEHGKLRKRMKPRAAAFDKYVIKHNIADDDEKFNARSGKFTDQVMARRQKIDDKAKRIRAKINKRLADEKAQAASAKHVADSVIPLTLDNLFEKQTEPFERKGARPGKESFIVGGVKPKGLESSKGTMKRIERKFGKTPRVKSEREYYKNKSDQNYKYDPDWR